MKITAIRNLRFDLENGSDNRASSDVQMPTIRLADQLEAIPDILIVVPLLSGSGFLAPQAAMEPVAPDHQRTRRRRHRA
ncbi:MAG: hypothetical protein DI543_22735, partial [Bradyrhizobium icense]